MVSEAMEKALNAQFNAELYSGYLYLAMAAYFEDNDYSGFAAWMRVQADEELEHGMKFYDYILRRGAKVNIEAIAKPETEWESPLAAFEQALSHERYVTSLINDLVALAREEKDFATDNFLQWFVEEQVEEEENAMELVAKIKLADGDNRLIYELNKELGGRAPSED